MHIAHCTLQAGWHGSFHTQEGAPILNTTVTHGFPDMAGLVAHGKAAGLETGWYFNNCNCLESQFTSPEAIAKVYAGSIRAFAAYGFGGLKLDGCSQFRDTHKWFDLSQSINSSGGGSGGGGGGGSSGGSTQSSTRPVLVEDCHNMGGPTVLDNVTGELDCPMHLYRTGNDITPGSWESFITNLMQMVPFLHHTPLKSKPHCWAYPDAVQTGSFPTFEEDRCNFGAWAVTSSPLILGTNLSNPKTLQRIW